MKNTLFEFRIQSSNLSNDKTRKLFEVKTLNKKNFIIENEIEKTKLKNTRFEQNDMKLSF